MRAVKAKVEGWRGWGRGRGKSGCCSFKRITVVACCVNLVAALVVLRSFDTSFFLFPSYGFNGNFFSVDQVERIEESIRVRREAESVELVRAVRKLSKELSREQKRGLNLPQNVKQKLANEILQRLQGDNVDTNVTKQRETVDLWRIEKLEEVRRVTTSKSNIDSSISYQEAKMLKRVLESNWLMLLEGIGLWIPADVIHTEHNDKPKDEQDLEEIIPGRPLPPECHAELHTDYDGAAVRWGLTHHKDSAADCCQACLDQAKHPKPGEKKCNIWVYCPSEFGCYSPDIYEHKHQECWLKQAEKPRLNFKDKYSKSYRKKHPNAPIVVPWMSGVVGA
ncbi:uncharacterized protein LOC135627827 isoform X1 [Musa acuminata AAA Group]|uniref:uncharacterized protein LOC135627827 isoform X1 n=1 Tax=Musa acuminata AAA Group TaxID=214697 RepID=UPI0031D1D22A